VGFRFLAASDIHFWNGWPMSRKDPATQISDRLLDTVSMIQQIGDYAQAHKVEYIVLLGDIFHQRLLDALTLKTGVSALRRLWGKATTVIIPGDHDAYDAEARHYTIDVLEHGVISGWWQPLGSPRRFYAMPYMPEASARQFLADVPAREKAESILLMHQTVLGAQAGAWTAEQGLRPEELAEWWAVLSGHFHTSQDFLPTNRYWYLGAPMQHNFGDGGEVRGFWDVEIDAVGLRRTLVPVRAPQFHTLEQRAGTANAAFDLSPAGYAGDYLRLIMSVSGGLSSELESKMDAQVQELCDGGVRGVKVSWQVDQIEQKRRLQSVDSTAVLNLSEVLKDYVGVRGEPSRAAELTRVGLETLEAVRAQR